MLKFKRVHSGYYRAVRVADGEIVATIENGGQQGCCDDPNSWLVTYRHPCPFVGGFDDCDGEIADSYRHGKDLARAHAQDLAERGV